LYSNGKYLETTEELRNDFMIRLHSGLNGGKGGFGSMLRAIGAQIEKTTNREACRDLSGRRLRDINEEKRIKEWIAKQAQRKEESERKRRLKLERLAAQPKCDFNDIDFERNRSEIPDIVEEALHYGLQQQQHESTSSGVKRKSNDNSSDNVLKKKKHSLWLGIDDIDDDSDDSDEDKDVSNDNSNKDNVSEEVSLSVNDSIDSEITDGVKTSASDTKVEEELNESLILRQNNESIEKKNDVQNENNMTVNVNYREEDKQQSLLCIDSNNEVLSTEIIANSSQSNGAQVIDEPLNLMDYETIDQLESLGLDRLKRSLMALGLKCGGTLQERAKRLWSIRGLDQKDIPKNLFASKKNK
jgi:hypothetical protein